MSVIERYLSNLGDEHWIAIKKVIRYLQKIKHHMLMSRRVNDIEVIRYTNLDFASCINDLISTSSCAFLLAGRVISWKSVKQTLTTSSTMQA